MKIGILGSGQIAQTVVKTLRQLKEIECYAIASRSLVKAEAFKNEYGICKAYGSYEEMLKDPELELVYICSPHSHHYEHMMMCLDHGKALICEKAFTVNALQAEKIRKAAQEKKLFVTEAIWTRYMPSRRIISEILAEKPVGEIRALSADLFYNVGQRKRLSDPELAGGALLDVGVYCLNFALMFFGHDIKKIESSVQMSTSGVDALENITLFYADGRTAMLKAGIFARSDRQGIFYGERGYIVVDNINNPQVIRVFDENDQLLKEERVPLQISGYEYEFTECVEMIGKGLLESKSMPLSESIRVMKIMDEIRRQWDFVYPFE